ncbi:MAG TPA: UPF0182 family protein [Trichocoleus sp.]|jgi:uncharacterized membrane protein (UPF0182 family)
MVQAKPTSNPPLLNWLLGAIGVFFLLDLLFLLVAEGLWFQEVDYLQVFSTRLWTRAIVGLFTFGISFGLLSVNLSIAQNRAWAAIPETDRPAFPGQMGLRRLLIFGLLLGLTIAVLLLYNGQAVLQHWHPRFSPDSPLPVPEPLGFHLIWAWIQQTWAAGNFWQFVGVLGLAIGLLIVPPFMFQTIGLLLSLGFALVLSEHWATILAAFQPTSFHQTDPLFGHDICFYIFQLPVWRLLEFWLSGLAVFLFSAVSLTYLRSGNSLSQGYFPGFTVLQHRHLASVSSFLMLMVSLRYWIDRYNLLYSSQGVSFGASYTDTRVTLPVYTGLSLLAVLFAIGLLIQGLQLKKPLRMRDRTVEVNRSVRQANRIAYPIAPKQKQQEFGAAETKIRTRLISPITGLLFYTLIAIITGSLVPWTVQKLVVQPNELQLEQPYLERTIALTREAFDLSKIDVETFNPQTNLTQADLQQNNLTVKNIRLWDTRPLLETNRQLQRIRPYYEFPDADIDRYPLTTPDGIQQQQVFIAARELDYKAVPAPAQTWINQHLVYTHGYGFTVSPVNQVGEGGLPDYLIQGITPTASNADILKSIPIGKPRIYFGELTDTYVMTPSTVPELDYPSGSENVYNLYDGRGGVSIRTVWQRLLFAEYLRDWRMLLADDFTPKTRLLFRRNINQRIRTIAPFLQFDHNPYLVSADTGNRDWQRGSQVRTAAGGSPEPDESYLYWIVDAYTTSDRFPYADPLGNSFNYIRNSVKVVIDAYHGSVNFYVADPQDPVIQTWQKVFPNLFQPFSEMPEVLQQHSRYPRDLFQVQSNHVMTYHMTDPVVFYNREDLWRTPTEIYGSTPQPIEPYYLIMKLPIGSEEEFILLYPFTPSQRNNLIAWLAARSDGSQYGKMLLYVFPKQKLIFGPEQIEARINQDPVISQQISLWNRAGSRAAQGNLLVIPIEQSLLYVEPLYLEAEQNQLPTLVRVIVAFGNRIAMTETLGQSLSAVFQPVPAAAPIVRPVEENIQPTD